MKKSRAALVALIAAAAGYIGGLLSAPRSGKQTRRKLAVSASKAKIEGEKQLKKLYSELSSTIDDAEKQVTKVRSKANNELKDAIQQGREAREKARLLLTALHHGDADDPNLKAVIDEVRSAKSHLGKFVKSKPRNKK